jgi:hypothetical protein
MQQCVIERIYAPEESNIIPQCSAAAVCVLLTLHRLHSLTAVLNDENAR